MRNQLLVTATALLFAAALSACGTGQGTVAPAPPSVGGAMPASEVAGMKSDGMAQDGAMEKDGAMMPGDSMSKDGSAMAGPEALAKPGDRYVAYSPEALAAASQNGRAVLFFQASWCPTCRAADADFRANLDRIPQDVTVLQVDYDTASDLKNRYRITYQHTFVQVDGAGDQVSRWSGGGVQELLGSLR